MPPKSKESKSGTDSAKTTGKTTTADFSSYEETEHAPAYVSVEFTFRGESPEEFLFLAVYDKAIMVDCKWEDKLTVDIEQLPLDLNDTYHKALAIDSPLIVLLRNLGKTSKEVDPLMHPDNVAGACIDLSPLVFGQSEIFVCVTMILISTGEATHCKVDVRASRIESPLEEIEKIESPEILLTLTLLSGYCFPVEKEGTVYIGAIGLDGLLEDIAVNFGMSLSTPDAKKLLWATANTGGAMASTGFSLPDDDVYVPEDFSPSTPTSTCVSVHWNTVRRVLVDREHFFKRLQNNFLVDIAAVPKLGKIEVKDRFLGFIDARVLLQPGQFGVTSTANLMLFSDTLIPEDLSPLLDIPGSSVKTSARDPSLISDLALDDFGHNAYVTLRMDLIEPLVPKTKLSSLYLTLGFTASDVPEPTIDDLHIDPPPEDPVVDVRRIRKECGALAVHKELSTLACRGAVQMNQGIKKTAANKLLLRIRTMLKQFAPGDCTYLDWQDSVTKQHAAARRAVTASFAPQPPAIHTAARVAAARARMAGDERIAEKHVSRNLKAAPNHPRALMAKILRLLEARNDPEAKTVIVKALKLQQRNRFLLWVYGGQEYAKDQERTKCARAALRLSVRGDHSDGIANSIGWAGLHAMHHYENNMHAAFVAIKRSRRAFALHVQWSSLLKRWSDASGLEEVFWDPSLIKPDNPMLLAAAFFLCLRCYNFSEKLLQCYVNGCSTRGDRHGNTTEMCVDVYYLRAVSWLLRKHVDMALQVTDEGIKTFGPSAMMSQMLAHCLSFNNDWDDQCEAALQESERAGAEPSPKLLLQAALGGMSIDPREALQRAARAHQVAPGAHSALVIGRIYEKMKEPGLAESWAECAVKFEPLLADGWAFLGILAMKERDQNRARMMMRTARQVGPISSDLHARIEKLKRIVSLETMPDTLVKELCFCEYAIN